MVKKEGNIILALAVASAAGVGLWYLLKKKEPACEEGQTQTRTCPDGSVITTAVCTDGKWVSTGETCPLEEINAEIISHEWLTVGGQCVARIKVKNTGNVAFTGHIGFSIRPSNYTSFIDADYRDVGTIETGEEKTFTSNPITIPGDAAPGNVEAWVVIKYHDGTDYITLDEKREADAYNVPTVCTEGAFRCDPSDPYVSQKCVDGEWVGFESCHYGCDPATGRCKSAPLLNVLVQYDSDEDAALAQQIVNELKPFYNITSQKYDAGGNQYLIDLFMESTVPYWNIVVVLGGQYANDIYDYLYPDITEGDAGCSMIRYRQWVQTDTYGVAGYDREDTVDSVNRFINLAKNFLLPKNDEIICP